MIEIQGNDGSSKYEIDELDDYPSLQNLFIKCHLTSVELDNFLTYMERGITDKKCPEIIKADLASLHGDAVILYGILVGGDNV